MQAFEVSPRLFPPIGWFAPIPRGATLFINGEARWNKRDKSTHRYRVADVNGPVDLTVPIGKPESFTDAKLKDISLSNHGQWWHVHRVTLESAYGRTPFFEHYFPKFERFFNTDTTTGFPQLVSYLTATTNQVLELLGIDAEVAVGTSQEKLEAPTNALFPPYWQVRTDKLGFLPDLSILDLLFNLGPESALYLRHLQQR